MKKRSKKYLEFLKKIQQKKKYSLKEAVQILQENKIVNFDSSVEMAFNLNINPKKAEENLRGSLVLPFNNGKKKKLLVICEDNQIEAVKKEKVNFYGNHELIEKINREKWLAFDLIITTPKMMPLLIKLGKILGPKGLMPNLKTGTISNNLIETIKEFKKGKIEYRTDKNGNLHFVIAKTSFDLKKILANAEVVLKYVQKIKPSTVKQKYINNISISSSMSPGIKIDEN